MKLLFVLAIFVLPFGTAVLAGALTDRLGRGISGFCAVLGLMAGIWLFSQTMSLLAL